MIIVDANVLVYARVSDFDQHDAARVWLDDRLNGRGRVGLPWSSLLAFLRLVTSPRVFARPEPVASAWRQVEEWLDGDPVWVPEPSDRYREILAELVAAASPTANLIPDAGLAALAIDHGCSLASTDGDFARFPGLRWENPLAP